MVAILKAIDDHLRQGRLVYLHCWGGIGRTGTVVGCWLSRQGFQGTAALDRLRQLWQACPKSAHRMSPETHEQEQYIVHWEEDQ
jgi:protein-tyrosine phosphatase